MATTAAAYVPLCAHCQSPGHAACKGCLLVTYCSKSCQTAHWSTHKRDCKSPLKSPDWQPNWMKEHRAPAHADIDEYDFVKDQTSTTKYLWGNVPAFDTIQLARNEGAPYKGHLKVLFAASGDLRNVVKTVGSLPSSYGGNISTTPNDSDFDMVARNIILILLTLTIPDHQQAVETIIHCWYSAFIRPEDLRYLEDLRPLFQSVCDQLADREEEFLESKTWKFGKCSVSVTLDKKHWAQLLGFISVPQHFTTQQAYDIRKANTDAPHRVGHIQRFLLLQQPEHRICKEKFRGEGILLPFSHSRKSFTIPNPTLFLSKTWQMMDDAQPLEGWSFAEVLDTKHSSAANDIYGKLFMLIGSVLSSFKHRLSDFGANFELRNLDAAELPKVLAPGSFARIETSNIADVFYLGPHRTVCLLSPLLEPPSKNPHATLVTLFMNAASEMYSRAQLSFEGQAKIVARYAMIRDQLRKDQDVGLQVVWVALPLGRNTENYFVKYTEMSHFYAIAILAGAKMKDHHTIIEKWPTRPKLEPGSPGADAELAKIWGGFHSYMERYVEWKRTD